MAVVPASVPVGLAANPAPIPGAPAGLLPATGAQWAAFWASDVAQAIDQASDLPAVERLFLLRDERARSFDVYSRQRTVSGSQGQPVLNPLAAVVRACDAEIRALEDRLGLNPRARLQLGLQFVSARQKLDDAFADLEPQWDDAPKHDDTGSGSVVNG
jgi:hypothetical protein